ncbi:hypothetical protein GWK47_013121 [Chionoecetes opilio]|uniref:Reverse transcriptase domain-containing protein n=1 Tax=Chionoecetes opilio TaxID=41210 RepID=A0A8J4XUM1_CHIOP|nr:hypothetical protein GWK47_013121 [Chionoecetes opilio]
MDWVLGKVVDQSDCGATSLGNTKITDLVFADDAVIFAESLEILVMALEALHEEAKPLGLKVSWLKTNVQLPVVLLLNPEKVNAVISRLLFEVTEQAVLDTSEGSSPGEDKDDDFFKALMTYSYRGHQLYPPLQQDGERA